MSHFTPSSILKAQADIQGVRGVFSGGLGNLHPTPGCTIHVVVKNGVTLEVSGHVDVAAADAFLKISDYFTFTMNKDGKMAFCRRIICKRGVKCMKQAVYRLIMKQARLFKAV